MLDPAAYIDPRQIDWTDSFNPLARNGWRSDANPYIAETFQDPVWVAIRSGANLEPRLLCAPDNPNTQVQPNATYDQSLVNIDPHSWLIGLSASAQFPAGFFVQITDSGTGKTLFSQPVLQKNISGAANPQKGLVYYLATPHCFIPPAYPIVRIINNANTTQLCQVVLYTVAEMDL